MVKFTVTPALTVDGDQNVKAGLVGKFDHSGTQYSVKVLDTVREGGNPLDHCIVGLKNDSLDLRWDCGRNVGRMRMFGGLTVKDKRINVKATTLVNQHGNETYLNCTTNLDDDNTLRLIMQAKGGERPSEKNCVVGFVHRQADLEIEPRYNFATESVSCGLTYKVDDENKLRAIFDVKSNEGSLQWTNCGALGGGGDLRLTARATMDKAGISKPTLHLEKSWDIDS